MTSYNKRLYELLQKSKSQDYEEKMCYKRNSTLMLIRDAGLKKSEKAIVRRIDYCMIQLICKLNDNENKTLGCCCGHNKYNKTIVVKDKNGNIFEVFSGLNIPRKKRFYVKDKEGYYYIPEVECYYK